MASQVHTLSTSVSYFVMKVATLGATLFLLSACAVVAPAPPPGAYLEAPCCYAYYDYPPYYTFWPRTKVVIGLGGHSHFRGGHFRHRGGRHHR